MADVTLTLTANTDQYVKGINDAQKATQQLYTTVEKGTKREKGLIEDIEDELKKLEESKKKAWKVEDIEKYNKKIQEAKKDLNEYEKAGTSAQDNVAKKTGVLGSALGKLAIAITSVTVLTKAFKFIMESTETTSLKFHTAVNGLKAGLDFLAKSIATMDFSNFISGMKEAIQAGRDYTKDSEKLANLRREYMIKEADLNKEIEEQRRIFYEDDKTSDEDKIKASEKMLEYMKQKADMEIELARKSYNIAAELAGKKNKMEEKDIDFAIKNYSQIEKVGTKYNAFKKVYDSLIEAQKKGLDVSPWAVFEKDGEFFADRMTKSTKASAENIKYLGDQIVALGESAPELGKIAEQFGSLSDKEKEVITQGILNIKQAENQFNVESKRVFRMQQNMIDANEKLKESANKEQQQKLLKSQEDYQKYSLKLLEDYDKSQIESLSGKEKLEAQREFAIKQIKELRDQMANLGPITEEQMGMFQTMADNVWKAYYEELAKESETTAATPEQQTAISKALLGNMPELEGIMGPKTKEEIDKARKKIEDEANARQKGDFSFWNLLGLNPDNEDDEPMIDAIQQSAGKIQDILSETLDRRVEIAERERELLDTKISETQREVELEAQLAQEGFANNLAARQQYLAQLKIEREKALADEEAAIKKQQNFEKIIQTTSLLSSVAQILKDATKKGLLGLAIAPFAIATLWAIWAKAKGASTQLAEGGSGTDIGMITGKKHSQGGERFLDHVEVERGEAWGVLSRPASEKYGKVFHEMVSSFNKNEMPNFMPVTNQVNQVKVENSGPNSRLDKVITEQRKLNESLLKQSSVSFSGGKKIVKSGNKVRIIG